MYGIFTYIWYILWFSCRVNIPVPWMVWDWGLGAFQEERFMAFGLGIALGDAKEAAPSGES